ncbi:MerR family transcriptional regulator [Paenibacillus dendritiformis]|uniref:Transcriptional regulator n=1 Tax=Paenibacillus dendritiformis C454 TaxID=1131935 RepID=H3SH58_9BACL|nr:MerR family transcriptional regulator [Paenibacillus dendritiformis]EHQ61592.1 transcriptional regulator [Paenibacillus dendritiformis C454]CAH8770625.1 MerR family transcriptional regulator [Paenibacillus dendritiformis]
MRMTRSHLAKLTGLHKETIRYYELQGVLPAPERAANGYRVYTDKDRVRLKFIKDAKSLGYSLNEIKEVLQLLSTRMEANELREVVRDKIGQLEARIEALQKMKGLLSELLATAEEDIHQYLRTFRSDDDNQDLTL